MGIDESIFSKISVGERFKNLGGGTSTVIAITKKNICYRRGVTIIRLQKDAFLAACNKFENRECSSNDLKAFLPKVFASKGCNCTFLFSIAQKMELLQNEPSGGKGRLCSVIFK